MTYGGGTYVCTTSHTSGATFDSTKWIQVAAPGAAGATGATGPAGATGAAGATTPGWQNKIINGAFVINQRAVSGTVTLAAGAYGHDRWKGGASGATYTFAASGADTTVTLSAGTLLQVVEAANVSATSFVLSWSGTATARIYQGSASGSYAASPVVVSGLAAGSALTVEFTGGSVTDVQLEAGATSTTFARRPMSAELALCQRYYYRRTSAAANDLIAVLSAYSASGAWGKAFDLPVERRATPTVAVSAVADLMLFNSGSSSAGAAISNAAMSASTRSISFTGLGASGSPFSAGQAILAGFATATGWIAASAEL